MSAPTRLFALLFTLALISPTIAKPAKGKTWTDPETAAKEDPDFAIQGEYGSKKPGAEWGAQVVALGNGEFDVYLLEGGLPGLGWTREKGRHVVKAKRDGDAVKGDDSGSKLWVTIADGNLEFRREDRKFSLPRIERISPTLGAKPPEGAVVLFDGTSAEHWEKGKVENGLLAATGTTSKPRFKSYTAHLEFRTPYKPHARGQGRGNSGIYWGGRWETQVLDSFGLEGKQNECGGIYSIAEPILNMCLPPLTWQTYDVDFTAAKFDADGKRTSWPRITVKLNGVVVHDDLELAKDLTTAAPIKGPLKDEGRPVYLQNHGNPVFFRNIWVKEK